MIKILTKKVYEELITENDTQDKTIMYLQQKLSKMNKIKEENEYLTQKSGDYVLKIKELRKEIKKLKSN